MGSGTTDDGTTWALHPVAADADVVLRAQVAALLGVDEQAVRTGRLCPACGSSAHGGPWARAAGRSGAIGVSVSRSGEHLLTAVRRDGGVGVDIERIRAVDAHWDPTLVLHPAERADTPLERARAWARKEAILKLLGTGLRTPMPEVRTAEHAVVDLPAPPGFVAALAVDGLSVGGPPAISRG